jgi:hypothetical protein
MANGGGRHHKQVSVHAERARKSGHELARIARNRRGPVSGNTVEEFVESVEQYVEAARETDFQDFE